MKPAEEPPVKAAPFLCAGVRPHFYVPKRYFNSGPDPSVHQRPPAPQNLVSGPDPSTKFFTVSEEIDAFPRCRHLNARKTKDPSRN